MKATIKSNPFGNWYGYLGSKKVAHFMNTPLETQEEQAHKWLALAESLAAKGESNPDSFTRVALLGSYVDDKGRFRELSAVSTLPESKDAPAGVSVASTACPDCGHPLTAGYHMPGEACPSPSPLSVPAAHQQWHYRKANSVQPARLIRMVSPTSGGVIANFESDLDEVGQFVADTCNGAMSLKADVARLESALQGLVDFLSEYPHHCDTDISGYMDAAEEALSLSKGDRQ